MLVGTAERYNLINTSRLTQDVRAQLSSPVASHYPRNSDLSRIHILADQTTRASLINALKPRVIEKGE